MVLDPDGWYRFSWQGYEILVTTEDAQSVETLHVNASQAHHERSKPELSSKLETVTKHLTYDESQP